MKLKFPGRNKNEYICKIENNEYFFLNNPLFIVHIYNVIYFEISNILFLYSISNIESQLISVLIIVVINDIALN